MSKRSSKQSSSSPVVRFLKEWGLFSIIVGLIIASRIYLWAPVKVDGHSMDPTLADSEYLLVVNHLSIDRFDIVVASEKDDDGKTKDIVKRVIDVYKRQVVIQATPAAFIKQLSNSKPAICVFVDTILYSCLLYTSRCV